MSIKKCIFLILVACFSLVRGRATRAPTAPQRILVIQMAKLGDMVCTTPMMRAIKSVYPQSTLMVMGNRTNEALLADNTDVDRYLVFEGVFAAWGALRKEKFDAVCIAGAPDATSLAVAFLAGIPLIVAPEVVGNAPQNDVWYQALSSFVVTRPHAMGSYAPREYLRLLEPLSIYSTDTTKHLQYSLEAEKTATAFLQDKGVVVGIAPGAGNKIKEWPVERFAKVADALKVPVVLIGSAADNVRAKELIKESSNPEAITNACGMFSLDETKAVISKLSLFVAVDTGPIYIAEAFTVPTVDITGPIDEREQPPIGPLHVLVTPPSPRTPQLHVMDAHPRDPREARRQVEAISAEQVIDAALALLEDTHHE